MRRNDWRQQAEKLYFGECKSISDISCAVGVSKVSLSKYFNSLPQYTTEKNQRIEQHRASRKSYSKEHKRASRRKNRYGSICGDTIRREHATAVKILSGERFCNE
ncbi:MAG: hypothetical protein FWD98_03825 [Defluviitaleaceae bacterium]|nr:hypothetical protein [Defluviitaleaceae bacterium]